MLTSIAMWYDFHNILYPKREAESALYIYQQNCQNRTHSDKVNFKIVVVVQIKLKTSFENIKNF